MTLERGQPAWCIEFSQHSHKPRVLERVYLSTYGVDYCMIDYPGHYEQRFSVKLVFGTEVEAWKYVLDHCVKHLGRWTEHLKSVGRKLEELNWDLEKNILVKCDWRSTCDYYHYIPSDDNFFVCEEWCNGEHPTGHIRTLSDKTELYQGPHLCEEHNPKKTTEEE